MDIKETKFAKMWKSICPDVYDLAIWIATNEYLIVNIYKVPDIGWVIEPRNILPDFWLNVHFTREQAINECIDMNWTIR